MTIGPGSEWSHRGELPSGSPVFSTDRALSDLVQQVRAAGEAMPIVGLTGGTLWDAVGGPTVVGRLHTVDSRQYPVDIVRAETDDQRLWFVGALLARTTTFRHGVAVLNTPWLGALRLGHRSHPGDALLDITEGNNLSIHDLRQIIPRAKRGAHMPHPKLAERRVASAAWMFPKPHRIVIDGRFVGKTRSLAVCVEPDALTVVV